MMKPDDYIDKDYAPTEADFVSDPVDEKVELRKYIKRNSRFQCISNALLAAIAAFAAGSTLYCIAPDERYQYAWVAILVLATIFCSFAAVIYRRISKADSSRVMQHLIDKIKNKEKLAYFAFWVFAMAYIYLLYADEYRWYTLLLIELITTAVLAGIIWFSKRLGNENDPARDIIKLRELEEKEQ